MLPSKVWWVCVLSVWTCFWNSSQQRLSGEKANLNEKKCNMWIQVSHWSIRTSGPIQRFNLPPSLLKRLHQCQPLLSPPLFFYLSALRLLLTLRINAYSPIHCLRATAKSNFAVNELPWPLQQLSNIISLIIICEFGRQEDKNGKKPSCSTPLLRLLSPLVCLCACAYTL